MSKASDIVRENFSKNDALRDAGLSTPDDIVRYDDIVYGEDAVWQILDIYRPKAEEGKQLPSSLEDTNLVFTWVLDHAEEYDLDTKHVFAVGDSAPEGFIPSAIALNCGAYMIDLEGNLTDQLTKDLMADFLPEQGSKAEMELIQLPNHITSSFPPTFLMTATRDFLKEQAMVLAVKLTECDVPFIYRFYGDSEHDLGHVFHCNIKSEDAKLCNDEECEYFKRFCN